MAIGMHADTLLLSPFSAVFYNNGLFCAEEAVYSRQCPKGLHGNL